MSDYSVDKFYVGVNDNHGHNIPKRIHFIPGMIELADEFIAARVIAEYRNTADIIRDGFHHRLEWLRAHHDVTSEQQLSVFRFQSDVQSRTDRYQASQVTLDRLRFLRSVTQDADGRKDLGDEIETYLPTLVEPFKAEAQIIRDGLR